MRILDPRGRETPIGQTGEIAITGGFMLGYWGRPEKTAEVIRDGWLYTGDVGRMDADGYVFIRGRASERVTVSGEPWYPRDVEEALLEHPEVSMAALIGLPDSKLGERPGRLSRDARRRKGDRPRIDRLRRPESRQGSSRAFDQAVPSLPMTPTGKISKAELKEQAVKLQS